jgi:DedD protein
MRGVFDDEELEPAKAKRDTEFTLGSWTLLALFFGLVLICGLCFGLGYAMGHRGSSVPLVAALTGARAQTPLQADSSRTKPSASAQSGAVAAPQSAVDDSVANQAGQAGAQAGDGATPADVDATAGAQKAQAAGEPAATAEQPKAQTGHVQAGPVQAAQILTGQAQTSQVQTVQVTPPVRPAMTPSSNSVQAAQPVAAKAPAVALMVQIAAVSHVEDATVLVNALRKRGYAVNTRREPEDGLIHVRIGPFSSRDEADQWKLKLLNDGYNAIVQP